MLFVRKLTENECESLSQKAASDDASELSLRSRIILLSAQGQPVPQIAQLIGLHPINVRKWIHRFNKLGAFGLESAKSPGRPLVFSPDQRDLVLSMARKSPSELGLPYTRWSLQRLRDYLVESQLVSSISVETVRLILWSSGMRYNARHQWRIPLNFGWLEEFERVGFPAAVKP